MADVFEESNGGGGAAEEDNEQEEHLDPDQEAALERLAQEAMMDNDFTFWFGTRKKQATKEETSFFSFYLYLPNTTTTTGYNQER